MFMSDSATERDLSRSHSDVKASPIRTNKKTALKQAPCSVRKEVDTQTERFDELIGNPDCQLIGKPILKDVATETDSMTELRGQELVIDTSVLKRHLNTSNSPGSMRSGGCNFNMPYYKNDNSQKLFEIYNAESRDNILDEFNSRKSSLHEIIKPKIRSVSNNKPRQVITIPKTSRQDNSEISNSEKEVPKFNPTKSSILENHKAFVSQIKLPNSARKHNESIEK